MRVTGEVPPPLSFALAAGSSPGSWIHTLLLLTGVGDAGVDAKVGVYPDDFCLRGAVERSAAVLACRSSASCCFWTSGVQKICESRLHSPPLDDFRLVVRRAPFMLKVADPRRSLRAVVNLRSPPLNVACLLITQREHTCNSRRQRAHFSCDLPVSSLWWCIHARRPSIHDDHLRNGCLPPTLDQPTPLLLR